MNRLNGFRWAVALAVVIAVTSSFAYAQEDETLSISGPFRMDSLNGTVGDDLAQVYANGYDHTWTLTLHGVTLSHSFDSYEYIYNDDWGMVSEYYTHVHATSFDFAFSGPDAGALNAAVSQQLVSGGDDGVFLTLRNSRYYSFESESFIGKYGAWTLHLSPFESGEGVTFFILGDWGITGGFASDADGYPLVEPKRVRAYETRIVDHRNGNYGIVTSFNHDVNLGSAESPYLTPTLRIRDGSVREGNKGTTSLKLTVTLSASSSDTVTVNYATANGIALANSDYSSKSGTLTFQPGQTEATISISVKPDRKRESDETFTVRLSNAVGAIITDDIATATILNDD